MQHPRLRATTAAIAATCLVSCSTTATIVRTDGPDNEATIEGSDTGAIYVRGSSGQVYKVDRRQVADIDHPGNVALTVGIVLAGLAAMTFVETRSNDNRELAPIALMYGVPAVGLMLSGGYFYSRSIHAARAFETAPLVAQPVTANVVAPTAWQAPPPSLPPLPPPLPVPTADAGVPGDAGRD